MEGKIYLIMTYAEGRKVPVDYLPKGGVGGIASGDERRLGKS